MGAWYRERRRGRFYPTILLLHSAGQKQRDFILSRSVCCPDVYYTVVFSFITLKAGQLVLYEKKTRLPPSGQTAGHKRAVVWNVYTTHGWDNLLRHICQCTVVYRKLLGHINKSGGSCEPLQSWRDLLDWVSLRPLFLQILWVFLSVVRGRSKWLQIIHCGSNLSRACTFLMFATLPKICMNSTSWNVFQRNASYLDFVLDIIL